MVSGLRDFVFLLVALLAAQCTWAQSVTVELEQFGVGSYVHLGAWNGIRVRLTNETDEALPVRVQWDVPNADGDLALQSRSVTLSPHQPLSTWLYAWVSPTISNNTVWIVRAYEERDGRRRSEVGLARISLNTAAAGPAIVVETPSSLIGVIGGGSDGNLRAYQNNRLGGYMEEPAVGAMEATVVASGLQVRDLPDRWEGLEGFDALVWTNPATSNSMSPQDLTLDQADAIREFVRRGRHFIIILPEAGNPWGLGEGQITHLSDLLPTQAPQLREGVPFAELTSVLSKTDSVKTNVRGVTRVSFFDAASLDNHFEPFLAMPCQIDERSGTFRPRLNSIDGHVFAVQRTYGHGRITLVGIDVTNDQFHLLQTSPIPQPDAFWNRILGRRIDTPTANEVTQLEGDRKLISRGSITTNQLGGGNLVADAIGMQGQAAIGILAAVLLFSIYWVAAGPGGFAMLRQLKRVRHAWGMFVAMAVLFTAVAWGGVSIIGTQHEGIQHLTVIDWIHRPLGEERPEEPNFMRASVWFSVGVSNYGYTHVSVESERGQRNLLTGWTNPDRVSSGFPNIDRYDAPLNRPGDLRIPARSTESQLYLQWLGSVDPKWGGISVVPDDPIIQEIDDRGSMVTLNGSIQHNLPGTLSDVLIIYVNPRRTPLRRYAPNSIRPNVSQPIPNYGNAEGVAEWPAGSPLSLGSKLAGSNTFNLVDNDLNNFFRDRVSRRKDDPIVLDGMVDLLHRNPYMHLLSVFNMLPAPNYLDPSPSSNEIRLQRRIGRELDLSVWMTRPCLIVIGILNNVSCPVPITINDEPPANSYGTVMVRWIYPLPLDESMIIPEPR